MAGLTRKSFDTPDETRPFEDGKGKVEVINTDGGPDHVQRYRPRETRSRGTRLLRARCDNPCRRWLLVS